MRSILPALLLFVSVIEAHYYWPWLIVNGTQFPQWKYVRDVVAQDYPDYTTKAWAYDDVYSPDIACGHGAFNSANKTETADVVAGTEIGFRVNQGGDDKSAEYSGLNHPGPALAYLAKPPAGVPLEEFNGIDGDWFKIASLLAESDEKWLVAKYTHRIVNFTIPANTPPGKYLLRFEHISLRKGFRLTQFFMNCAHINVIGPGGGKLDGYPFAKFPGAYDPMDPAIWTSKDLDTGPGLLGYVGPGPALWTG